MLISNKSVPIESLLTEAGKAARAGDRQRAYELSLEATRLNPNDTSAWLLRADLALSPEETLICLNRVNDLNPHNQVSNGKTYQAVQDLLADDPFLAYIDETDDLYHVRNGSFMALSIPKKRAGQEPYPVEESHPLRPATRWLVLAVLGLFLSGVATLVFAPLAVWSSFWANRQPLKRSEHIYSFIVMGLAALVWIVGIVLSLFFLFHLRG